MRTTIRWYLRKDLIWTDVGKCLGVFISRYIPM